MKNIVSTIRFYDAYKNIFACQAAAVYYEYVTTEFIRSDYVHQFIFIVIVIASLCVGIQTYDLDEQTEHFLLFWIVSYW